MQIVKPIDIADALRRDVGAMLDGVLCCAQPAPDDLRADTVCFSIRGGSEQTAVATEYGVAVDCWAGTFAEAIDLANTVYYAIQRLALYGGDHAVYTTVRGNAPYPNPDPLRPTLPRATFNVQVGARGTSEN